MHRGRGGQHVHDHRHERDQEVHRATGEVNNRLAAQQAQPRESEYERSQPQAPQGNEGQQEGQGHREVRPAGDRLFVFDVDRHPDHRVAGQPDRLRPQARRLRGGRLDPLHGLATNRILQRQQGDHPARRLQIGPHEDALQTAGRFGLTDVGRLGHLPHHPRPGDHFLKPGRRLPRLGGGHSRLDRQGKPLQPRVVAGAALPACEHHLVGAKVFQVGPVGLRGRGVAREPLQDGVVLPVVGMPGTPGDQRDRRGGGQQNPPRMPLEKTRPLAVHRRKLTIEAFGLRSRRCRPPCPAPSS